MAADDVTHAGHPLTPGGEHYVVAYEGGLGACRCGVVTSDGLIDAHVREANGA